MEGGGQVYAVARCCDAAMIGCECVICSAPHQVKTAGKTSQEGSRAKAREMRTLNGTSMSLTVHLGVVSVGPPVGPAAPPPLTRATVTAFEIELPSRAVSG